jgi:hypothetical protein
MLKKHAHHLAFALAFGALFAYGAGVYLQERANPDVDALSSLIRQRQVEMKTPKEAPPPARLWEHDSLSPWTSAIGAVVAMDPWTGSLPTHVIVDVRPPDPPPRVHALAPAVAFEKLDVQLDGVTLGWSVREWTSKERQALLQEKKVPVDLTSFKIERKGAGGWESIATLDAKARSYKDAATQPKTTYVYRITALSTRKEFLANDPSGVAGILTSPAATTPGLWKVRYVNPGDGVVWVWVEKYEKALGAKVEIRLLQREGERVGWKEGTSKHRVKVAQRFHEVDFDTGLTLLSVKPKTHTIVITKCKAAFLPGGGKVFPCPTVEEARTFAVSEVLTVGPEGRQAALLPDPKDHPNAKDQICPGCPKPN